MKNQRNYDEEFKKDAVCLLMSSGRKLKDVAEELGLERSTLGNWRKQHLKKLDDKISGTEYSVKDMENDNKRLRRELAEVIIQRDILKKACGILSDRPRRSMS